MINYASGFFDRSIGDWLRDQWHTSGVVWGLTLVAGVAVLISALVRGDAMIVRYFRLRDSERLLRDRVAMLERQNSELTEEARKLKVSPDYAKKVLRERFNYVEDGEEFVFVPED